LSALGQVIGCNAAPAGFGDLETVVGQMTRGENEQLRAMASFMPAGGMHTASTSATGRS
jgi:N-acetylmuramidase